ncbi:hypothetical protein BDAP_000127 [Binucleata daphniae]
MNNIQELVNKNDHAAILQLDGDLYDQYKIIANIKLERYQEAMKLAKKHTFEFCYCLYKQKKYANCIKIIEKMINQNVKNEEIYILYAQSLYHLGYYNKSAEIMNKINKPFSLINLMATESMCLLSNNEICRYKVNAKDEYKKITINYDSCELTKEQNEELTYNKSFRYLANENEFVNFLENNSENKLCTNQLNNVLGNFELIDTSIIGKKDNEIIKYNKETDNNANLEHFQKHNYEYDIFCKKSEKIVFKTDNLRFLYALKLLKKKKVQNVTKLIQKTKDSDVKKMFSFLTNRTKKSQKIIIDALKHYK